MKLNEIELQSFIMTELNTYDLSGLSIEKEVSLKEIRDELIEELEDLNSDDTKKVRLEHFKVKGATKDDYSEKVIHIDSHKRVIYGIRNLGGNPKIPYIQLRPNFKISSKEESLAIYELIKREFEVFNPLYLSFHSSKRIDADFYGSLHMVAKSESIIDKEKWPLESSLEFESITDDSYYDWYKKGYEEFNSDIPELKSKVTVNSLSSMEDSLEQGLLKYVLLNGERIGLIAGEESNLLGHSGIYFHEIFISKEWKGRGIAKAIQRKFIHDFCTHLQYVWGTIDSNNLPSYKTAYSNGRRAIRYECFINL